MSEPEKRYVKLHWQAVAGIVKKATGLRYSGADTYRYYNRSDSFYCREESGYGPVKGGVRVLYAPVRDGEGKVDKEAADATLAKMMHALQDAGYAVDHKPGTYTLVVTKEAPPAPPKQPFRMPFKRDIALFEHPHRWADSADERRTVRLSRTIHRTHEGDFPTDEYTIAASGREPMVLSDSETSAAICFAHVCEEIALAAIRSDAERHPTQPEPDDAVIAAQHAAWEIAMAAYKEQYPGPEPEIAR